MLDLSFDIAERFRPFALVAPGFEQLHQAGGQVAGLRRTEAVPVAPFVAVELQVDTVSDAGVAAGLATADGQHLLVTYDPQRRRVAIELRRAGRTTVLRRRRAALGARFGLAFVLCENQVTAVADTGDGWRPLVTVRDQLAELVDLRDPETLQAHALAYGTRSDGEPLRLSQVRGGPFGYTGLRDPHLVQRPDGSAVVRDGKAYLTFTCAGMGFFQQAHWGVFTLDLADPSRFEQVAQLYSRRDGRLLGDHAGQLVLDEDAGRTIVGVSSWGDFAFDGVHVRHAVTDADLLSGVHVLETEPLELPTAVSSWDPSLTRIDGRWHVAFVESPSQDPFRFHPALAVGPPGGSYADGLQLVGADPTSRECEGPIIQQVDGRWYVLASSKDEQAYPVYDLSMRRVGALDAPYPSNIPHPQVVERPGGGHLIVSFDGTPYGGRVLGYGGHGDVVVMSTSPLAPLPTDPPHRLPTIRDFCRARLGTAGSGRRLSGARPPLGLCKSRGSWGAGVGWGGGGGGVGRSGLVGEVLEHLPARQLARGAHHAAAGMGAGPALVVPVDRRPVLAPARRRPEEVHLRGEELPGEDVALAEPDHPLDVERGDDLTVVHQVAEAGEERLQRRLHGVAEPVPLGVPVAALEVVRGVLDEAGHDVLARRAPCPGRRPTGSRRRCTGAGCTTRTWRRRRPARGTPATGPC